MILSANFLLDDKGKDKLDNYLLLIGQQSVITQ